MKAFWKAKDSYWFGIILLIVSVFSALIVVMAFHHREKAVQLLAALPEIELSDNSRAKIVTQLDEAQKKLTGSILLSSSLGMSFFISGWIYLVTLGIYRKQETQLSELRKRYCPETKETEGMRFPFWKYKKVWNLLLFSALSFVGGILLADWLAMNRHIAMAWGVIVLSVIVYTSIFSFLLAFRFHKQLEQKFASFSSVYNA